MRLSSKLLIIGKKNTAFYITIFYSVVSFLKRTNASLENITKLFFSNFSNSYRVRRQEYIVYIYSIHTRMSCVSFPILKAFWTDLKCTSSMYELENIYRKYVYTLRKSFKRSLKRSSNIKLSLHYFILCSNMAYLLISDEYVWRI